MDAYRLGLQWAACLESTDKAPLKLCDTVECKGIRMNSLKQTIGCTCLHKPGDSVKGARSMR